MTLRDYISKVEAHYCELDRQSELLRRVTFLVSAPYHKKGTEPMDMWVIGSEREAYEAKKANEAREANRAFVRALKLKK